MTYTGSCDRCRRTEPLVTQFIVVGRHVLCADCNIELTAFRSLAADAMLDFGGHIQTVTTRRRPRTVDVYNKVTHEWETVRR